MFKLLLEVVNNNINLSSLFKKQNVTTKHRLDEKYKKCIKAYHIFKYYISSRKQEFACIIECINYNTNNIALVDQRKMKNRSIPF